MADEDCQWNEAGFHVIRIGTRRHLSLLHCRHLILKGVDVTALMKLSSRNWNETHSWANIFIQSSARLLLLLATAMHTLARRRVGSLDVLKELNWRHHHLTVTEGVSMALGHHTNNNNNNRKASGLLFSIQTWTAI